MHTMQRRTFLHAAVAGMTCAGAATASEGEFAPQAYPAQIEELNGASGHSPLTLAFRLGAVQWLTDEQWGRLLEFFAAHRPAVDELSLFTHENMGWFGTVDEMAIDADLMARRIREAHAAGYRAVGINVLCTLGHGDPVGTWSPPLPLPPVVGHDGRPSTHCPCPNSPAFRQYTRGKYQLFAAARPDFIWVDDDVRASQRGVTYPCFCAICLEAFGHGDDRAELVRRMNDPAETDLRRAWVDFNAATLARVCQDVRDAVRAVDPAIELGLMSIGSSHSTYGGHALGAWTTALGAVRGRPGHGFYTDETPRNIYNKALDVGRQTRDYAATVSNVQYELENYPYVALDKAHRTMLNEVYLAIMMGCNGAAFNALKATPGTLDDFDTLLDAIAAERPAWERLVAHAADLPAVGFWPADDNALMGKRVVDATGWFWEGGVYDFHRPNTLLEMGIPLSPARPASCGTILSGRIAEALTDSELRELFAHGVLLDSSTLDVLWARGMGEWTGVRPGHPVLGGVHETLTAHPLNGRFGGDSRDALADASDHVCALEPVGSGLAELARLTGYDGSDHGSCLTVYENELGGRVAVSSYAPWRRLGTLGKRSQLAALADWLSHDRMPVRIDGFRRVAPFVRMNVEGSRYAVLLINSTLDPAEPFELRVRATAPTASLVAPQGTRSLTVRRGEREVRVAVPALEPWRSAVILGS